MSIMSHIKDVTLSYAPAMPHPLLQQVIVENINDNIVEVYAGLWLIIVCQVALLVHLHVSCSIILFW